MNPEGVGFLIRIAVIAIGGMLLVSALTTTLRIAFGAGGDGFVRMLEARMQVYPGAIKVLPDCQCSVRYMGTTVKGRHYTVHLDKLD